MTKGERLWWEEVLEEVLGDGGRQAEALDGALDFWGVLSELPDVLQTEVILLASGYTQAEIAELMGVNGSQISRDMDRVERHYRRRGILPSVAKKADKERVKEAEKKHDSKHPLK